MEKDKKYFVRVPDFQSKLLKEMNILRRRGFLCDTTISTRDGCLPVHRLVLVSISPYFRKVLSPTPRPDSLENVFLDGISFIHLSLVIEFMYTGCLELSSSNVQAVVKVCKMLQLKEVLTRCMKIINNLEERVGDHGKGGIRRSVLDSVCLPDSPASTVLPSKANGIKVIRVLDHGAKTSVDMEVQGKYKDIGSDAEDERHDESSAHLGIDTDVVEEIVNGSFTSLDSGSAETRLNSQTSDRVPHGHEYSVQAKKGSKKDVVDPNKRDAFIGNNEKNSSVQKDSKSQSGPMSESGKKGRKRKRDTSEDIVVLDVSKDFVKDRDDTSVSPVMRRSRRNSGRVDYSRLNSTGQSVKSDPSVPFPSKVTGTSGQNERSSHVEGKNAVSKGRQSCEDEEDLFEDDEDNVSDEDDSSGTLENNCDRKPANPADIEMIRRQEKLDTSKKLKIPCRFGCTDLVFSNTAKYLEHSVAKHTYNDKARKHQVCVLCGEVYRQKVEVACHQFKHHSIPWDRKRYDIYKCERQNCDFETAMVVRFKKHIEAHDAVQRVCEFCDKVLANDHSYKIHQNTHKAERETINCDECGQAMKSKLAIKRHKERFHMGERETQECEHCGAVYMSVPSLRIHMFREHNIDPPQTKMYTVRTCNLCGFETFRKDFMKRHMKKHEDKALQKVNCNICGRMFGCMNALSNHMRMHREHSKFPCKVNNCSEVYKLKGRLLRHMEAVHGIQDHKTGSIVDEKHEKESDNQPSDTQSDQVKVPLQTAIAELTDIVT